MFRFYEKWILEELDFIQNWSPVLRISTVLDVIFQWEVCWKAADLSSVSSYVYIDTRFRLYVKGRSRVYQKKLWKHVEVIFDKWYPSCQRASLGENTAREVNSRFGRGFKALSNFLILLWKTYSHTVIS